MNSIRHFIFILAGLIIVGLFSGFVPVVWLTICLVLSVGANNFTGVLAKADELRPNSATLPLMKVFMILSLVLAVLSAVFLFLRYGWIPALAIVILYVGYFSVREDRHTKWKRSVERVKSSVLEDLRNMESGKITRPQMEERSLLRLQQELPYEAHNLSFLYDILLDQRDLSNSQYRLYISVLEKYLSRAEARSVLISDLHRQVRNRLASR
jgi:hypothetical protein